MLVYNYLHSSITQTEFKSEKISYSKQSFKSILQQVTKLLMLGLQIISDFTVLSVKEQCKLLCNDIF
jgi:hypothetical protein